MTTSKREALVLRRHAEHLARELGQTPEQVLASLREAIDAGLIRVTRRGIQATVPEPDQ